MFDSELNTKIIRDLNKAPYVLIQKKLIKIPF